MSEQLIHEIKNHLYNPTPHATTLLRKAVNRIEALTERVKRLKQKLRDNNRSLPPHVEYDHRYSLAEQQHILSAKAHARPVWVWSEGISPPRFTLIDSEHDTQFDFCNNYYTTDAEEVKSTTQLSNRSETEVH